MRSFKRSSLGDGPASVWAAVHAAASSGRTLTDYLHVDAIGVEDVCGVVQRMVVRSYPGRPVINSAGAHRGPIEGIDSGSVLRCKGKVRASIGTFVVMDPEARIAVYPEPVARAL